MDIDLSQFEQVWLNLSGGKDSQTLALQMVELAGRQGVCGRLRAVHSDTGAEWSCTRSVVQDLCRRLEIPLEIVTPKVTIPEYVKQTVRRFMLKHYRAEFVEYLPLPAA